MLGTETVLAILVILTITSLERFGNQLNFLFTLPQIKMINHEIGK